MYAIKYTIFDGTSNFINSLETIKHEINDQYMKRHILVYRTSSYTQRYITVIKHVDICIDRCNSLVLFYYQKSFQLIQIYFCHKNFQLIQIYFCHKNFFSLLSLWSFCTYLIYVM